MKSGRALLRKFASDAMAKLHCAFGPIDTLRFRIFIRAMWMRRARLYFDGRNEEVPYIEHRYTIDDRVPHTYGNIEDLFGNRRFVNFNDRNGLSANLGQILYIHHRDRVGHDRYDVYNRYLINGMSEAEYYFEYQIDQFYRLLFFAQELIERGIVTDNDDFYEGAIPYDQVPKDLQLIVGDEYDLDFIYRDYLWTRRRNEERIVDNENVIRQNLARTARVREEYLVLLFETPSTSGITKSTTSTTTTTTTTATTSLTTVSYEKTSKRKGSVYSNKYGKHFKKWPRTLFPDSCCDDGGQSSNAKDLSNFTDSCLRKHYDYNVTSIQDIVFVACSLMRETREQQKIKTKNVYFGHIVKNDNSNQLLYPQEDPSVFVKSITEILGSFVGVHHTELR